MLHLETVHRHTIGNDGLEQVPQRRNIPLPVAEREQQAPQRLFGIDLEDIVEGPARRQHPEPLVQDDERLGDRIDDGLGEKLRIFQIADRVDHKRVHAPVSRIISSCRQAASKGSLRVQAGAHVSLCHRCLHGGSVMRMPYHVIAAQQKTSAWP